MNNIMTDLQYTRQALWRGSILATIGHATWTMAHPDLAYEQSWEGNNYNVSDSMGAYGTVNFGKGGTVGLFFTAGCTHPIVGGDVIRSTLFQSLPPFERPYLDEALQYMLQERDGTSVSIVTSGFWSDSDQLISAVPWPETLANGAHLIQTQLLPAQVALKVWQRDYDLSRLLTELVWSLFERRINAPDRMVTLTPDELTGLIIEGSEGWEQSHTLFQQIGIILPANEAESDDSQQV